MLISKKIKIFMINLFSECREEIWIEW